MALTVVRVSDRDIAGSKTIRLDNRYHYLHGLVSPFFEAIRSPALFGGSATFSNGCNISRSAYEEDIADDTPLYASVAPFSSFAFRADSCVGLKTSEIDGHRTVSGTKLKVEDIKVAADDVLITRSGTPGIAWPGVCQSDGMDIVPSGFMIRARVDRSLHSGFVAALFNHPAWRLLSTAMSAGKRQDNLGQEVLATVPLPTVQSSVQEVVASRYLNALGEIGRIYSDEAAFTRVCDEVLSRQLQLPEPVAITRSFEVRRISLGEVAATRNARIDNRWHSPTSVRVRSDLEFYGAVRLSTLLLEPPAKGRQPVFASEEDLDDETPRAIATGTLQSGTVVWEQAKYTTKLSVDSFPVTTGEMLVAMDGDGSLGKAAVYTGNDVCTVDSHIARCRVVGSANTAHALSCFLNSTWGRTQTTSLMTGATGQTQLAPADLAQVLVPSALVPQANEIAAAFAMALRAYEPLAARARRRLCEASADITDILRSAGALTPSVPAGYSDPDWLFGLLETIYPRAK